MAYATNARAITEPQRELPREEATIVYLQTKGPWSETFTNPSNSKPGKRTTMQEWFDQGQDPVEYMVELERMIGL